MTGASGVSSLGVKFGYAAESTAGTRPTTGYEWVERCNSIGGYAANEQPIDSSALEDNMTRYIPGRVDGGGTQSITFNRTNEVITALQAMLTVYATAKAANKGFWWTIWTPSMTKAEFIKGAPPVALPIAEKSQNALQTMELTFVVEDATIDTAVEPVHAT